MATQTPSIDRTVTEHTILGIRQIIFPLWITIALGLAAITATVSYFTAYDGSVWVAGASSAKFYLGVVGILMSVTVLPLYVTNGITRRHFVIGGSIVVVATAVIAGLLTLLGYGVESVVFDLAGMSDILEEQDAFRSVSRAALIFVAYTAGSAAYMCGGWLIGSGYYRWGAVGGTVFILVALLPVIGTEYLLNADMIWDSGVSLGGPAGAYRSLPERIFGDVEIPVGLAALVAFALIAAGLLLNHRLLRDVTIK